MRASVPEIVIPVQAGGEDTSYRVLIGPDLLSRLAEWILPLCPAGGGVAVISDSNVAPLYGDAAVEALRAAGASATLLTFPAGEESKSREQWMALTDRLLEAGFGRDTLVMGLGGGVTGDLAGFVAATFMRGVPLVQVPTSLLAMIDSSVGGKTGVDVPAGKNLVGAFHPPRGVFVDPGAVTTLPMVERSQGLAEALKHGAIRDEDYFRSVVDLSPAVLDGDTGAVADIVARSVRIKAEVVSRDEREGGLRQILNLGHTVGHALEAASGFGIPHGAAVGLGMVLEARLGEALGVTSPGTAEALGEAVARVGLPPSLQRAFPGGLDVDHVIRLLAFDKKVRRGESRYVLLERIGRVAPGDGWVHSAPESLVREVLEG